jgi:hypothetical protein
MITVVEQKCDFWHVDRLEAKVIQVVAEHLNQALVISDACLRVKNGSPNVSTARWRLMPLVHL